MPARIERSSESISTTAKARKGMDAASSFVYHVPTQEDAHARLTQ